MKNLRSIYSLTCLSKAISGALVLGLSLSVHAVPNMPPYPAVMPLNSLIGDQNGFRMDGILADQMSGYSVTGIGDFNHDGVDDVAIGAPRGGRGETNPPSIGGAVFVVFGRPLNSPFAYFFDLSVGNTLKLEGANDEWTGASVSAAGDVNGDGVDDLLIGANHASTNNTILHGAAYVVFGKDTTQLGVFFPQTIDLLNLPIQDGFRITSSLAYGELGDSVSPAGDINGDGIDDILIGAPGAGPLGDMNPTLPGSAYVIFGHKTINPPPMDEKPFPSVVDVVQLNGQSVAMPIMGGGFANGFRIDGAMPGDSLGRSVSSAGKMNNDAYSDIVIGAPGNDNGAANNGSAYVVLGRALPIPNNGVLTIGNPNTTGVVTLGAGPPYAFAGRSVAGGGDVNGDGRPDLLVGGNQNTYVVYGQTTLPATLSLGNLTSTQGFRIEMPPTTFANSSVSILKDINGDSVDDLLIANSFESPQGKTSAGNSYVLFGRKTAPVSNILSLLDGLKGIRGYRLEGAMVDDESGFSVAAAGDMNGDGLNDLIIGAPSADPNGVSAAGSSYTVLGNNDRIFYFGAEPHQ